MLHFLIILATAISTSVFAETGGKPSTNEWKDYAPPTLNKEVQKKIQSYLDIRSPGFAILHPNQKSLYFNWRVSGVAQVWMLKEKGEFPLQLTSGEDPVILSDITPDGKLLILQKDEGGQENPGLFVQSSQGGPLEKIHQVDGKQTFYSFTTDDSNWIYFRSNDVDPASYALYRYSVKKKTKELLFSEPGTWAIVDHQADGHLLLAKYVSSLVIEYYQWDPKTKKAVPALGVGDQLEIHAAWAPGFKNFIAQSPYQSNYRRLYLVEKNKWKAITPPLKFDIEDFWLDKSKRNLLYSINENGFSRLRAIRMKDLKQTELNLPKDAVNVMPLWISDSKSPHGMVATLRVELPKRPPEIYVYQFGSNKLTRWLSASTPEMDVSKFAEAKLEFIPARDQTPIPILVRRPSQCSEGQESKCPVIVNFHGGPEGQSRPGYDLGAQIFVDEGFIFVEPNVRGSDGYGMEWLNSDNGPKRLNVITDIEDVAKHLRTKWNTSKMAVMGGSYGGYSTLYAMTKFAGTYDAGVAYVGMSNLLSFLQNTAPYRRALRISEYGDPEKDKDALIELSPLTHINKLNAPLLIVQGANDPRVPVTEAVQMYQAMQKKKLNGKLIVFPDEGHGNAKRANQVVRLGATIEFLNQHLKTPADDTKK